MHVPFGDHWDAETVSVSLRSRGIDTCIIDDAVRITLPKVRPQHIVMRLFRRFFPEASCYVMIRFRPEQFLGNIELDYDPLKTPVMLLYFDEIADAMRERGYWIGSARRIAGRYNHSHGDLTEIFDELDRVQAEQEQLIERQDFKGAASLRDRNTALRQRIDATLLAWCKAQDI